MDIVSVVEVVKIGLTNVPFFKKFDYFFVLLLIDKLKGRCAKRCVSVTSFTVTSLQSKIFQKISHIQCG